MVSRGAPHLPRRAKMYYVAVVVLRSNGAALAVSPSTETPFYYMSERTPQGKGFFIVMQSVTLINVTTRSYTFCVVLCHLDSLCAAKVHVKVDTNLNIKHRGRRIRKRKRKRKGKR